MNGRRAAALAVIFSTLLAGTYTALRVTAPGPASATETPTALPSFEGCAYVWAYEDLPEVSAQFDAAVKELIPAANGRAQAFGENCVYGDGHADFGAMETDFYVSLEVQNHNDEAALGDQMAKIMTMVLQRFPRASLPGGQDGFVEFTFRTDATDPLILRVPIRTFRDEAQALAGAELFQKFSASR